MYTMIFLQIKLVIESNTNKKTNVFYSHYFYFFYYAMVLKCFRQFIMN